MAPFGVRGAVVLVARLWRHEGARRTVASLVSIATAVLWLPTWLLPWAGSAAWLAGAAWSADKCTTMPSTLAPATPHRTHRRTTSPSRATSPIRPASSPSSPASSPVQEDAPTEEAPRCTAPLLERSCGICLEPLGDEFFVSLRCHETHCFHAGCLSRAWRNTRSDGPPRCPYCRTECGDEQLRAFAVSTAQAMDCGDEATVAQLMGLASAAHRQSFRHRR